MTSLPQSKPVKYSDKDIVEFFDQYYTEKLTYPANQVDAVVDFFRKRGFDNTAAVSTATVLLRQAKLDEVNVFKLLDTLKGLDEVQLSNIVAEILNYNRPKSSSIGYKVPVNNQRLENRNIAP